MINKYIYTYILICFLYGNTGTIVAQDYDLKKITLENYKEVITDQYYKFQAKDEEKYLDNILYFVELNEIQFKEDSLQSRILYLKGCKNIDLKQNEKADEYFKEAYVLAKKTNDYLLLGTICNNRGLVSLAKKRYSLSEEYFLEAVENYKKVNALTQLKQTYYNLTECAKNNKKWHASIKYSNLFFEAVKNTIHNMNTTARIYYFIAYDYLMLKNYTEVLRNLNYFEKHAPTADALTNKLINEVYAKYYEAKEQYDLALNKNKLVIKYSRILEIDIKEEINDSYHRELVLNKDLTAKKDIIIKSQNYRIYLIAIIILLLGLLVALSIWFSNKNKLKNNKIEKMNVNLENLNIHLEEKNKDLAEKRLEKENLLELNEQTLFSRALKISTQNDSIKKIIDEIEKNVKQKTISSSYLLTLNKKLSELVPEDESWEEFKVQFEKIHPDFFKKLLDRAPTLSINDLKHCTYIVSELKSKEVSQLINISTRSVETIRYRIKKKVGLKKDENLYEVLSKL